MKHTLILLIALATSFSLPAQEEDPNIKKETRELNDFDKLKVTKGINVTLVKGDKPGAEINIVNAPTSDVIIENEQNELTIKMKTRVYQDVSVQVYLTYNELREISVGSGGNVEGHEVLSGSVLILDAGLDSVIDLKVDVDAIEANASAARITLNGYANKIEVKATTGAKFQGQNLESKNAYITANTGAIVSVNVSDMLNAKAATGATIEYTGDPDKIETKERFGGTIDVF